MNSLTQENLKEFLRYEPETGLFYRLTGKRAGEVAGHTHHGYIKITVAPFGGIYAHRLAWLYVTGAMPTAEVDHIDRDRANNAWSNLRLATRSQNQANTSLRRNNTSGYKGVRILADCFRAKITIQGRIIHLGDFDTLEEAVAAYGAAARVGFGSYARVA